MKVNIVKDGHSISDFKSEKEALQWFADNEGLEIAFEPVEYILCAAYKVKEYPEHMKQLIEKGTDPRKIYYEPHKQVFDTVTGWRHPDIMYRFKDILADDIGGFLTSKGRYVDREEAYEIALNAGQIEKTSNVKKTLFSEDLY